METLLKTELRQELCGHIIPFWKAMKDNEHGGFYGLVNHGLQINKKAVKGCILNSRILWFFSSAALQTGDKSLIEYANHAFNYMQNNFYDAECGGLYWSLNYDGTPKDTSKHIYCQAFGIYALAAYYKLGGSAKALELAQKLFELIEEKKREDGGYGEAYNRFWQKESNEKLSENGVHAKRTMNTLLHVMEAYAGLYDAQKDKKIETAIEEILLIFEKTIYNPKKTRLEVFFDEDYNSLINLQSYGHDIEASWLLDWAAGVLPNKNLKGRIAALSSTLAEQVYKKAFNGTALYNECENGIDDKNAVWWVQAEGMVGFYNAWQKQPQKKEYLQAVHSLWAYCKNHIIDKRSGGEWFWFSAENEALCKTKNVVDEWKCPYHNGRMCLELMKRLP